VLVLVLILVRAEGAEGRWARAGWGEDGGRWGKERLGFWLRGVSTVLGQTKRNETRRDDMEWMIHVRVRSAASHCPVCSIPDIRGSTEAASDQATAGHNLFSGWGWIDLKPVTALSGCRCARDPFVLVSDRRAAAVSRPLLSSPGGRVTCRPVCTRLSWLVNSVHRYSPKRGLRSGARAVHGEHRAKGGLGRIGFERVRVKEVLC
jgi:hypothetical protein